MFGDTEWRTEVSGDVSLRGEMERGGQVSMDEQGGCCCADDALLAQFAGLSDRDDFGVDDV